MQLADYQRAILVVVVYVAFFEDGMLTTCLGPVAPDYLVSLWHADHNNQTTSTLNQSSTNTSSDLLNLTTSTSNEWSTDTSSDLTLNLTTEVDRDLLNEANVAVGMLFAVKGLVQLVTNIGIGLLADRIGYSVPMFAGFVVSCLSSLLFAFNTSYTQMLVSRALLGLRTACVATAGMGMVAAAYPDDGQRATAISRAFAAMGVGSLLGAPYGGYLYSLRGIQLPFLILAALAAVGGVAHFLFIPLRVHKPSENEEDKFTLAKLFHLLRDPYIINVSVSLMMVTASIALTEPSLPIYLKQRWQTTTVTQGLVFVPVGVMYLVATQVSGPLSNRLGRIPIIICAQCLFAVAFVFVPLVPSPVWLILPMALCGLSTGLHDACSFAELPRLVDVRHTPQLYGSVYAIADMVCCLAFFLGPLIGGPLIAALDFPTVVYGKAAVLVLCSPLILFNRNVQAKKPTANDKPAECSNPL